MPITHDQWKLGTFILGLSWLFWGALTFDYPDWDVKLSLLMALGVLTWLMWHMLRGHGGWK